MRRVYDLVSAFDVRLFVLEVVQQQGRIRGSICTYALPLQTHKWVRKGHNRSVNGLMLYLSSNARLLWWMMMICPSRWTCIGGGSCWVVKG